MLVSGMITRRTAAILEGSVLLLVVVPFAIPFFATAGILPVWDVVCGLLLFGSLGIWTHWFILLSRRGAQTTVYLKTGWLMVAVMAFAFLGMCARRPKLAEDDLVEFGIRPNKEPNRGGWKVLLASILHIPRWENSGHWQHDSDTGPIESQMMFDRIAGLLALCNPTDLALSCGARVTDLRSLGKLRHLKSVSLTVKAFASFDSVAPLPKLERLMVFGPVRLDLSDVSRFAPKLQTLTLSEAWIGSNQSTFAALPDLTTLRLLRCETFDGFPELPRLPRLRSCCLEYCAVTDLGKLAAAAPKLNSLRISQKSPVLNLRGIERFNGLRELNLMNCTIDASIEHTPSLQRIPKVHLPSRRNSAHK